MMRRRAIELLVLLLTSFVHCEEIDAETDHLKLFARIDGDTICFVLKNVGTSEIELNPVFETNYGWPESCWLQLRDSDGKILVTSDTDLQGYWTPQIYESQANTLPIRMGRIHPQEEWIRNFDLKACVTSFFAWPHVKSGRGPLSSDSLRGIESVRFVLNLKLDSTASRTKLLRTEWLTCKFLSIHGLNLADREHFLVGTPCSIQLEG
jgi:hypothetical protein